MLFGGVDCDLCKEYCLMLWFIDVVEKFKVFFYVFVFSCYFIFSWLMCSLYLWLSDM